MDYNNYSLANDRTDWPAIRALEERTGVRINWIMHPAAEFGTIINTELAAGFDLPDIVFGRANSISNPARLLESGVTVDLLPLIEEHAPNLQRIMRDYPTIAVERIDDDGRMFSLPYNIATDDENLPAIMLREDWVDKLGMSMPETVEEFTAVLRAFKNGDPNGNGVADEVPLTMRYSGFLDYLKPGFGIHIESWRDVASPDPQGEFVLQFARPEYREWVAWTRTLYEEELIDRMAFNPGDQNERIIQLLRSETSVLGGVAWWSNSVAGGFSRTYLQKVDPDATLTVVPPPRSRFVSEVQVRRGNAVTGHTIITRDSSNPEAAIRFIDFCFSPEGSEIGNWGILGDSYDIVNGDKVFTNRVKAEEIDPNWYLPEAYGLRHWLIVSEWEPWGRLLGWTESDFRNNDVMKSLATLPAVPGLVFTESERLLREEIMGDLLTFVSENEMKFITGVRPMSEWDSFVDEALTRYRGRDYLEDVVLPAHRRNLDKISRFAN